MGTETKSRKAPVATKTNIKIAYGPMLTLLVFSTAMLVLPLGTYFYIRHYILNSTTFAAMGAVVVVQVIIALYIYKAWTDETKEHLSQKRNDQSKKKD